jgi:RND family efflux transporter MFP subunit
MPRARLVASVVACALPSVLSACGGASVGDPRTEAPVVRTAYVGDTGAASRSFTGVVGSRVQSDLGFRIPGKVLERFVDVGETVRAGQPLMRIDATDFDLSADAQNAAVDAAEAQAKAADKRTDHYQDLYQNGAVSKDEYNEVKAAERAAEAELEAAKGQADIADNTSGYTELVADHAGVIVETAAEPGQVVSAGQTVVQLAQAGPREAVIQLPETLRPEVGSTGLAKLYGKKDTAEATLRQLSSAADPVTRTFDAHYVLQGALADAPLGSTVTVDLPDNDAARTEGLRVPIGAVVDEGEGPGVWAIEGDPPKTAWRPVSVERLDADYAYVTGEVSRGDRVVALGAHLIRDGERVRIETSGITAAGSSR